MHIVVDSREGVVDYSHYFKKVTGKTPYPYQQRLGEGGWPDLLNVPTGLGKTSAVVVAWLYKRRMIKDPNTPRRLVYCLPMRVLVEQTEQNVRAWLKNHRLFARESDSEDQVKVTLLMGGDPNLFQPEWIKYPQYDNILIGTQDMLLSRALMRGYASSRYQWPIHYAFLHNDALWVFDEIQLMGAGLPTSAQLEAFRRTLPVGRKSRTLWVSATLNPSMLSTVDFRRFVQTLTTAKFDDKDHKNASQRINAIKQLHQCSVTLTSENIKDQSKLYLQELAKFVKANHKSGTQTLIILNRVERAQGLYRALKKQYTDLNVILLHARFRAHERKELERILTLREFERDGRVVVATQAVEAGVDITSQTLITELAPWSSMVQRFGRCNRYGECHEGASIYWVDIFDEDKATAPYDIEALSKAREVVGQLSSASPQGLPKADLDKSNDYVLRRKDFIELFNTEPDLTGLDIDISPYIRDQGSPQVLVFWRKFNDSPNDDEPRPSPVELCPASISQLKDYLKNKSVKERRVWIWDPLVANWQIADQSRISPGMTLLLASRKGGYTPDVGFEPKSKEPVTVLKTLDRTIIEANESDGLTMIRNFVKLTDHLNHVKYEATKIGKSLLSEEEASILETACQWHDVGKAHEAFQNALIRNCESDRCLRDTLWAKAKSPNSRQRLEYFVKGENDIPIQRPHFRHELASMLVWLEHGSDAEHHDLIAYLILAHHGKVRMGLRALPNEPLAPNGRRFARGIWDEDRLPSVQLNSTTIPDTQLSLDIMELGSGRQGNSWTARTQKLLADYGPFRLAWYEALVRIADWIASKKEDEQQAELSEHV